MKITGNEPAMPQISEVLTSVYMDTPATLIVSTPGLTIRQQFAMAAMQGFCAVSNKGEYISTEDMAGACASLSVKFADALINELNKSDV